MGSHICGWSKQAFRPISNKICFDSPWGEACLPLPANCTEQAVCHDLTWPKSWATAGRVVPQAGQLLFRRWQPFLWWFCAETKRTRMMFAVPYVENNWVWLKIKELGQTAGFSLWFHLPGCQFGTTLLSHSQFCPILFSEVLMEEVP